MKYSRLYNYCKNAITAVNTNYTKVLKGEECRNNLNIAANTYTVLLGREPEGSVGTKLVNKAHGDFWEGIHP